VAKETATNQHEKGNNSTGADTKSSSNAVTINQPAVAKAASATWWHKTTSSNTERQQSADETQNQTIAATINWQCQKQSWFVASLAKRSWYSMLLFIFFSSYLQLGKVQCYQSVMLITM